MSRVNVIRMLLSVTAPLSTPQVYICLEVTLGWTSIPLGRGRRNTLSLFMRVGLISHVSSMQTLPYL